MPLTIKQRNHIVYLIEATVDPITSEPYELVTDKDYTIVTSTLGTGEEVIINIYDYSKDTFQPLKVNGDQVKMIKDFELLTFSGVSCIIQLVKSATVSPVGVTIVTR